MALDKIDFEIIADAQKAIAALTKVTAALQAQIAKLRENNAEAKRGQNAMEGLAGSTVSFVRSALGIGSAIAALRTFVGLLDRGNAIAKEAGALLDEQIDNRKLLAQIQQSPELGKKLAAATGLPVGKAMKIEFEATSAGFTDQETTSLATQLFRISNAETVEKTFTEINRARRQFKEAGTPQQALDQMLAGRKSVV